MTGHDDAFTGVDDTVDQFGERPDRPVHLPGARRAGGRPVSLYINSPGGSFDAMTAVYDTVRFLSCDLETFRLGQAGSGAAVRSRPARRGGDMPCPAPG